MADNRIEWIDIAKGIGIILVIAGHTFYLGYSYPLYAFHMPLFFFLSGLLFVERKQSFSAFLKNKTSSLLKPWLIFLVISLFVCLLIPEYRNQITLKAVVSDLYTANTNVFQNSSLWYLICFFFMLVIFYFVKKIKRTRIMQIVFLLFFIALLWIKDLLELSNCPFYRLPFKIDSALIALFFFLVAYRYKEIFLNLSVEKCNINYIIIIMVLSCTLCVLNGWTNINSLDFGRVRLLYYPTALLSIGTICIICQLISRSKNGFIVKIKPILIFYGKNSLLIFGFQSLFIRLYLLYFNKHNCLSMELYGNNPLIHQIGSFLFVTSIMPLIVYLFGFFRKKGIAIL